MEEGGGDFGDHDLCGCCLQRFATWELNADEDLMKNVFCCCCCCFLSSVPSVSTQTGESCFNLFSSCLFLIIDLFFNL